MSPKTRARWAAAAVALAPAVVLAAFAYHPHIGSPIHDDFLDRLAGAVLEDPARWAVAHMGLAVGNALIILAFLALRSRLRAEGEERWSAGALPFIVVGSVLYALLPAMEFAPLAAARAGHDAPEVAAVQAALGTWFRPTHFAAAIVFLVGAVGFAAAVVRSGVVGRGVARLTAAALVVAAVSRFAPLSPVQFHLQGVAWIVALWPLVPAMGRPAEGAEPAESVPATAAGRPT